jgi:transposase
MKVPDSHIRINTIAAISNQGALRFMTYKGTMTAALFLVFLTRLLQTTTRKVFLIADRLSAHEAAAVDSWAERHEDRIELFYLPRRAPELNPAEYLNNDLKGNVNEGGLPGSKQELRSRVQGWLRTLFHWPARVASYFEHPCVNYAAGP